MESKAEHATAQPAAARPGPSAHEGHAVDVVAAPAWVVIVAAVACLPYGSLAVYNWDYALFSEESTTWRGEDCCSDSGCQTAAWLSFFMGLVAVLAALLVMPALYFASRADRPPSWLSLVHCNLSRHMGNLAIVLLLGCAFSLIGLFATKQCPLNPEHNNSSCNSWCYMLVVSFAPGWQLTATVAGLGAIAMAMAWRSLLSHEGDEAAVSDGPAGPERYAARISAPGLSENGRRVVAASVGLLGAAALVFAVVQDPSKCDPRISAHAMGVAFFLGAISVLTWMKPTVRRLLAPRPGASAFSLLLGICLTIAGLVELLGPCPGRQRYSSYESCECQGQWRGGLVLLCFGGPLLALGVFGAAASFSHKAASGGRLVQLTQREAVADASGDAAQAAAAQGPPRLCDACTQTDPCGCEMGRQPLYLEEESTFV